MSGAPKGSALVKVLVTLSDGASGKCVAKVEPEHVHVFHGSAIRWRVLNNCTKPPVQHLTFTQPQLSAKVKGYDKAKSWNYKFCTATIATLSNGNDEKNVLFCQVPDDVEPGHYKYGLAGAAEVDPEIEVHKGG